MEAERASEGKDFMDEEEVVTTVVADRNRRLEDYSSVLAEKLLQGWTLLNEHCPQCLTPLVRNRQKKMYCAACRQWILTEAEAAARLLQQRVDRSDVAEQNGTNSVQQTAHSSTTSSTAPAPQSPAYQANGKSNGIGHLRLSLASLRADEEQTPDSRNPKRVASSDHVQDAIPRPHLMVGKENGNSTGIARKGVTTAFQREADHSVVAQGLPKPALVLQPIVNPVNDILVSRRTLTTLNEKLEGIRQLISNSHDVNDLRQLFAVLEECIHAIQDLALQLQIPRYVFITCGATLARFFQGCGELITQGTVKVNADDSRVALFDGKVKIPGLPALRHHELVVSFRRVPVLFTESVKDIMAAPGILINTFYELEASVIDSLLKLSPIKGQKFYPIGPILRNPSSLTTSPALQESEHCIRWLDSQPDSSVLYISFGTLFRLKPLQITELALGLERSKHRFLWVLPQPPGRGLNGVRDLDPELAIPEVVPGSDMLPPGFEERVAERGFVVKDWAPQVRVLSHPSTGGFLTHCGWNSCLEAVSRGVTMLAWPISAEQHLNCRHLVDELKVASEVKKVANDFVGQEEVERVVRLFMEEERIAMRGRINVLKLQAAAALGVGGSSTQAFQQLVQEIKNL